MWPAMYVRAQALSAWQRRERFALPCGGRCKLHLGVMSKHVGRARVNLNDVDFEIVVCAEQGWISDSPAYHDALLDNLSETAIKEKNVELRVAPSEKNVWGLPAKALGSVQHGCPKESTRGQQWVGVPKKAPNYGWVSAGGPE